MGIIFFPLMKKSFYTIIMRVMIGLAIGSLSGSSLFHLIPAVSPLFCRLVSFWTYLSLTELILLLQAFDLGERNDKGQSYNSIAVFMWLSMWTVMLLECTIKIVVKTRAVRILNEGESSCDLIYIITHFI